MRDEGGLAKGAGEGWSYPFWSKACDLFVYLNVLFRSYQFEEKVPSTFVANIHQDGLGWLGWLVRGFLKQSKRVEAVAVGMDYLCSINPLI